MGCVGGNLLLQGSYWVAEVAEEEYGVGCFDVREGGGGTFRGEYFEVYSVYWWLVNRQG